jgi:hypothetical protein
MCYSSLIIQEKSLTPLRSQAFHYQFNRTD